MVLVRLSFPLLALQETEHIKPTLERDSEREQASELKVSKACLCLEVARNLRTKSRLFGNKQKTTPAPTLRHNSDKRAGWDHAGEGRSERDGCTTI